MNKYAEVDRDSRPVPYINNAGQLIISGQHASIFLTLAFTPEQALSLLELLKSKEKYIKSKVEV